MIINDIWFEVIMSSIPFIIALLGALFATFVKPLMDAKIDAETLQTIYIWVERAVAAAQQLYTPEQWKEKKTYVVNFLSQQIGDYLTAEEIDILIEAAVKELKIKEQSNGN